MHLYPQSQTSDSEEPTSFPFKDPFMSLGIASFSVERHCGCHSLSEGDLPKKKQKRYLATVRRVDRHGPYYNPPANYVIRQRPLYTGQPIHQ